MSETTQVKKKNASTRTRAQIDKAAKQDRMREYLSNKQHLNHIEKLLDELADDKKQMDSLMVQRKKIVIDTKVSLMKKYLPDLKNIEITGAGGGDIKTNNKFTIEVIGADSSDPEEASAASKA